MDRIDYTGEALSRVTSLFKDAPIFKGLIESVIAPYEELQDDLLWLVDNLLNIDEATGSHLDLIGNLPQVGQPRLLLDFNAEAYFGFDGAYKAETFGTISDPDVGGYWNSYGYLNTATSRRLNDDEYRRIIKARIIKNNTNCCINDLVEVVNLLTNNSSAVVSKPENRLLKLQVNDEQGFLAYFVDRIDLSDNILPLALGVRLELIEP